jgi:hypothetical protein
MSTAIPASARTLTDKLAAVLAAPLGRPADAAELLAQVARLPALAEESPEQAARTALGHLATAGLLHHAVARPGQVGVSVPTLCLLRAALAYVSPLYDLMFAMQGLGSYGALASGSAPEGVCGCGQFG